MIHYITQNGIGNAWVANELSRLEAAGVPFVLHTMRRPDRLFHESAWAVRLNEQTRALYPLRLFALVSSCAVALWLFKRRFLQALWNAAFGERENLRARVAGLAHFAVACHWARAVRAGGAPVAHVHSQWISSCGTIAMFGSWLLGVPFSFTGHATDLFRDRCSLKDKISHADFIVCISEFHRQFYLKNGAKPEQCLVVYCGIDPTWFYPPTVIAAPTPRLYRIVASGRLVEKKGFAILIAACKLLAESGETFECVIGGSGPLQLALNAQIVAAGLSDRVTVSGQTLMQERIVDFMHGGDVYALPCVWAADGDVDGLPQMLMEAMACGVPAISTRLVGIPDLIRHEHTGLLVAPNNPEELAAAIRRLMRDRSLGHKLGTAGREWVLERFDLRNCLDPLIDRYQQRLGLAQSSCRVDQEVRHTLDGSHANVPAADMVRRVSP